jgi:hypothetical protein
MKRLSGVILAGLMAASVSAQAVAAFASVAVERTIADSKDQRLASEERPALGLLQLARRSTSSDKTVVKTKKDGTVVTKHTTKTNDGEGNKTTTTTTTDSSSGYIGVSYEDQ